MLLQIVLLHKQNSSQHFSWSWFDFCNSLHSSLTEIQKNIFQTSIYNSNSNDENLLSLSIRKRKTSNHIKLARYLDLLQKDIREKTHWTLGKDMYTWTIGFEKENNWTIIMKFISLFEQVLYSWKYYRTFICRYLIIVDLLFEVWLFSMRFSFVFVGETWILVLIFVRRASKNLMTSENEQQLIECC